MRPFRIVVTGSRDWSDLRALADAIFDAVEEAADAKPIIIQGGAQGADALALHMAKNNEFAHETFEADWQAFGRAAGPIRNRAMLDSGADLVLAFPVGGRTHSPGTWDCIEAAAERGIPVRIFPRSTFEETKAGAP